MTFFGTKGFKCALEAIFATVEASFSKGMLNMVANIFAPAWTNSKWRGSSTENYKTWGALFKPLQKGFPVS